MAALHSASRLVAVVMALAALMDLIDTTIVNIALPAIGEDLAASGPQLEWVVSAYLLGFASVLITAGRVGDLVGRKKVFLAGVTLFALASAAAAAVRRPEQLIACRAVQGLAGGVLVPQVLGTFRSAYRDEDRRKVFALYGIVAGLAASLGVLLGGMLTSANLFGTSWRAIFLVNLPIAVVVLAVGARAVPETRDPEAARPDVAANALLVLSMVALLYPLQEGGALGWPAWCFAVLVVGLAAFVLLVAVEMRGDWAGRVAPLLQPALLRQPAYGIGLVVQMLASAGLLGLIFACTLLLQAGRGLSAAETGGVLLALTAGGFLTPGNSSRCAFRREIDAKRRRDARFKPGLAGRLTRRGSLPGGPRNSGGSSRPLAPR